MCVCVCVGWRIFTRERISPAEASDFPYTTHGVCACVFVAVRDDELMCDGDAAAIAVVRCVAVVVAVDGVVRARGYAFVRSCGRACVRACVRVLMTGKSMLVLLLAMV